MILTMLVNVLRQIDLLFTTLFTTTLFGTSWFDATRALSQHHYDSHRVPTGSQELGASKRNAKAQMSVKKEGIVEIVKAVRR